MIDQSKFQLNKWLILMCVCISFCSCSNNECKVGCDSPYEYASKFFKDTISESRLNSMLSQAIKANGDSVTESNLFCYTRVIANERYVRDGVGGISLSEIDILNYMIEHHNPKWDTLSTIEVTCDLIPIAADSVYQIKYRNMLKNNQLQ